MFLFLYFQLSHQTRRKTHLSYEVEWGVAPAGLVASYITNEVIIVMHIIHRYKTLACMMSTFILMISGLQAQNQNHGISWNFDEAAGPIVHDSRGAMDDRVEGFWDRVPGVEGTALQFDGYTTQIVRPAKDAPDLGNSFTVSAWVAIDDYPWNWVPIADQELDEQVGFFFGIDAFGHVGFDLDVNGVWQQLTSTMRLPLKKWCRVTATFDGNSGLEIYINGMPAGTLKVKGTFFQAEKASLIVGRVREPTLPFPSWLIHPHDPVNYSFDGYLDELEILPHARSAQDERTAFTSAKVSDHDVIPYAVLPSGPADVGPFGAFYATLKFKKTWDRMSRFGPDSDVVVRFDESPIRLVFWRGTNYMPAWVTENGKWYNEQSVETWEPPGCTGGEDCEPMSDKQSRYSRVSILESSPARAVVHWRYALAETRKYQGAVPDPNTGWFDWVDEYWTVYPDGVAIRKQILWGTDLDRTPYEWQETIVINGPGQRPEDDIQPDALTLENMQGETHTYSWGAKTDQSFDYPKGPHGLKLPKNANIQIVNLKSQQKPFEVVPSQNVHFHSHSSERSYSMFAWWNHWPVAQIPSSGRPAVAADRTSHSSLSDISWDDYEKTSHTETKLLMTGLTSLQPQQLLPLAKSWLSPPAIKATGTKVLSASYDPAQRAFVIHRPADAKPSSLLLTIEASPDRPLVDPAFLIENWSGNMDVYLNGHLQKSTGSVHIGASHSIDRDDAVLWMKLNATERTQIRIQPVSH